MRFLKILGMVVALHVVLFTVFLLSPGCQSNPTTPAPTPAPEADAPTSALAPVPVDENWSSQPASTARSATPAPAPAATNSVSSTISSAPLPGVTNVDGIRATPARPSNPESYVSTGTTQPTVLNPTTHVIRAGDTLGKIAVTYGTTTAALQKANPGIRPQSLRVGQMIKLPANITTTTPATTGATATTVTTGARYTVKTGDSLSAIAARNGTTVTALRQANNLRNDTIQVGQELVIPGVASGAPAAPSTSGYTASPAPVRSSSTISGDASTATFEHTLKSGETLGALSKRYGVPTEEIMAINNITDPRKIRAGQKLVIPGSRGASGGAAAATATPRPATATPAPAPAPAPVVPEPPPADLLQDTQPLIPADISDAPAIPVDDPVPAP